MTRWAPESASERAMRRRVVDADGCWLFEGSLTTAGYGQIRADDGRLQPVHRVVYEALVGPIPDSKQLDHECHNRDTRCPGGRCKHRRCFNPEHVTPATNQENHAAAYTTRTGTCKHGHAVERRPDGSRIPCRPCARRRWREWKARQ